MTVVLNDNMQLEFADILGNPRTKQLHDGSIGQAPEETSPITPGLIYVKYCTSMTPRQKSSRYVDTLIFQRPSHRLTIEVSTTEKQFVAPENTYQFDLLLPPTVYVFVEGILKVYGLRTSCMKEGKSQLYPLKLPNMYSDGNVCLPEELMVVTDPERIGNINVGDLIRTIYDSVWNSNFNTDSIENIADIFDLGVDGMLDFYAEWEKCTKISDVFNIGLKDHPAYDTLIEVLEDIHGFKDFNEQNFLPLSRII